MEAFNTKRHSLILFARVFFLILLFLLAGLCTFFLSERLAPQAVDAAVRPPLVILDAGHGGEDGGAVGVNGVHEKDINLAVANELASLLRAAGVEVILTRTEDKLLYGEGEDIRGERKKNDLKKSPCRGRSQSRCYICQHSYEYLFGCKIFGLTGVLCGHRGKSRAGKCGTKQCAQ